MKLTRTNQWELVIVVFFIIFPLLNCSKVVLKPVINVCPSTLTRTHTAGSVVPETKTVTYGVVKSNLTGEDKCWITRNLGASEQAGSATDTAEAAAGWYWQFNNKQGYKHDGIIRTPNATWINSIDENSNWVAANDPCTILLGTDWRIPTYTEWINTNNNGGWTNYNDTYSSVLKLHASGRLNGSGFLDNRGSYCNYWSNLQESNTDSWRLNVGISWSNTLQIYKYYGLPVRCIKD